MCCSRVTMLATIILVYADRLSLTAVFQDVHILFSLASCTSYPSYGD